MDTVCKVCGITSALHTVYECFKFLSADGIRVVGISPGRILTDRLVELFKSWAKKETGDENNWRDRLDKAEFKPGMPCVMVFMRAPKRCIFRRRNTNNACGL